MPRIIDLPELTEDSAATGDFLIAYDITAPQAEAVKKISLTSLSNVVVGFGNYGDSDVNQFLQSGANITISGNLNIDGDLNTVNQTTLDVTDKLITVANGGLDSATVSGAGLKVDYVNASLLYNATGDKWVSNKPIEYPGQLGGLSSTDSLSEGSLNLYYTDSRADARISNASISSSQLTSAVSLTIYDSAGVAIKTLYGAGV
jgi:hypothetical protein